MTENEKVLFHLALCGAVFAIGYTLGQRKAAAQKAAEAVQVDPMTWFLNHGGTWQQ